MYDIYVVQRTLAFRRSTSEKLKSSVELHEKILKELHLLATRLSESRGLRMEWNYSAFTGLPRTKEFPNILY